MVENIKKNNVHTSRGLNNLCNDKKYQRNHKVL